MAYSWALLETFIILPSLLFSRDFKRSFVNKKCPIWLDPKVISNPWAVVYLYDFETNPALFINKSKLSYFEWKSIANFLTVFKSLKSKCINRRLASGTTFLIVSIAYSALSLLRQANIINLGFSLANS